MIMSIRARSLGVEVTRNCGRFENAHSVVVEDRDFAERMALPMLGCFRLAREYIQRHLLELRCALFGKHHLDGADVGGAVKAPEGHVRHGSVLLNRPARRALETRLNRPDRPAVQQASSVLAGFGFAPFTGLRRSRKESFCAIMWRIASTFARAASGERSVRPTVSASLNLPSSARTKARSPRLRASALELATACFRASSAAGNCAWPARARAPC